MFLSNEKGFTLIELLIGMLIMGIISVSMMKSFRSQTQSYRVQQQVVDMQQTLRAAIYKMKSEIRMAGLDPTGNANASIVTAAPGTIRFTMDFTGGEADGIDDDGDGLTNEGDDHVDNDNDGLTDEADESEWFNGVTTDPNEDITYTLTGGNLTREVPGGGAQPLGLNIDALNFIYFDADGNQLDDDGNGNVTTSIADIRSVQITMIANSGSDVKNINDNKVYTNQMGDTILDKSANPDKLKRRVLTTEVKCRNLGLI